MSPKSIILYRLPQIIIFGFLFYKLMVLNKALIYYQFTTNSITN